MADKHYPAEDEIDLREIFAVLWSHKILIGLIVALSIFLSGYKVLTTQKLFTASVIFRFEQGSSSGFDIPSEFGLLASFAGVSGASKNASGSLLERIMTREFILHVNEKASLVDDPFFNSYNPNSVDPFWKAKLKELIGWQTTKADKSSIIEKKIISNYKANVKAADTEGGSISIAVTHTSPEYEYYTNNNLGLISKVISGLRAPTDEEKEAMAKCLNAAFNTNEHKAEDMTLMNVAKKFVFG